MKITVIGATGNVGSSAAFNIAIGNITEELILIDVPRPDMLAMHALDINTAVTGRDMVVRAGEPKDMKDSGIVVIAAGSAKIFQSRLEVLPQNLPILQDISKNVRQYCPDAVIITATNPVCPLNYAMYRCSKLERMKIIGYTYNDTIRFRMRLAEALGVKSSQVQATVIGEHGDSQVLLFSSVRVKGKPVSFTGELKEKLRRQVPEGQKVLSDLLVKTGRTAAWTTGVGLAEVCRAIARDTGEMIPCSVTLDGEYGQKNFSMSVPSVLGKEGVRKILELKLAPDEQEGLKKTVEVLTPAMKYVEELLHLC